MVDASNYETVIKVIGIGGAGGNAIDRMKADGLEGVEYVAINTDAKDLASTKADVKLDIDSEHQKGQGAGGDPAVGRKSAEEHSDDIKKTLEGADLVFVTAGEGGGTGTGGAPVAARIAKELGALTIGVVTRPFNVEGSKKLRIADAGIEELRKEVDALIVIPNENLLKMQNISLLDAFHEADKALRQGVEGISDIILAAGYMSVDFADVKSILKDSGTALMGIGSASGPNRVREATEDAISLALNEATIDGSTGGLVKLRVPQDFPLEQYSEALSIIQTRLSPDADFISGLSFDPELTDEIFVTVIASGAKTAKDPLGTGLHSKILDEVSDESAASPVAPADPASAASPAVEEEDEGKTEIITPAPAEPESLDLPEFLDN